MLLEYEPVGKCVRWMTHVKSYTILLIRSCFKPPLNHVEIACNELNVEIGNSRLDSTHQCQISDLCQVDYYGISMALIQIVFQSRCESEVLC